MPTARSNAQCPYCDHVSPVGSKFCNDCGAALHLRPCPHCGSVNDITLSTHCSRCNGELDLVEPAPTPIEMPLLNEVIEASPPVHDAELSALPEGQAKAGRTFVPLIAMTLIAVAAASYYGLSTAPKAQPNAAELIAARPAVAPGASTMARAAAPAEQAASAPAQTPAQEAAPVPALAASLAKLSPPSAGRSPPPPPRREAAFAPAAAAASPGAERYSASPRARQPGEGLDLKQPTIGTCTDAVAALGLCTQEPNPRRP